MVESKYGASLAPGSSYCEVLSHQSGRSIIEVWDEALRLHRVRYETERLFDDREEKTDENPRPLRRLLRDDHAA
jgi:hypothetical protein